ncbi:MAG: tRNA-dependent cyclodipeptide synthase [Bacteroidetes bacterium]|nr:tRNA-dependent cyclodipeptide synthase [Bacteroidota bacterium]
MEQYEIRRIKVSPKALDEPWTCNAYIGLSVNNQRTKSEQSLLKVLRWVEDRTDHIMVLVGDYLNRHNMKIRYALDEAAAIERSMDEAEGAVRAFSSIVSKSSKLKVHVISIKSYYERPDFNERYRNYELKMKSNRHFSDLVKESTEAFIKRIKKSALTTTEIEKICQQYILEEMVVFEMLAEDDYRINIYPGKQLPVMEAIVNGKLKGVSDALEKIYLVDIKFKIKN